MPVEREMPRYKCHKEVWALKILEVLHHPNPDDTGQSWAASYGALLQVEAPFAAIEMPGDWVAKHRPLAGGYLVQYEDGYRSFSPAEAFESGYRRVADWKDRLLLERDDLKKRLTDLIAFLPRADYLPPADRELLGQQAEHMSDYLAVLDKRIAQIVG